MAVSQAFDTPLERLGLLPNGMNWRGGWDATTQYYQNDVVTSPSNLASYILDGPTALLGGVDPSLNPDWIELSATTTGVIQVNAGAGITIGGTATVPIVENDGILTITSGNAGIQVVGGSGVPPLNAIISNTGLLGVQNGLGINITGPVNNPFINNNGVRTLTAGNGITVNNADPNNPVVINGGVTSIINGGGLTVTNPTGPIVTITNEAVLTVVAGTGITVNNTDPQNPIVTATAAPPVISKFNLGNNISFGSNTQIVPSLGSLSIQFALQGLFIGNAFTNGTADPNGTFVFDFSGWCFTSPVSPATGAGATIDYTFEDSGTSTSYLVPLGEGGETLVLGSASPSQLCIVPFPRLVIPLASIRAAGLTNITSLTITNNTSIALAISGVPNTMVATYYPNGPQ